MFKQGKLRTISFPSCHKEKKKRKKHGLLRTDKKKDRTDLTQRQSSKAALSLRQSARRYLPTRSFLISRRVMDLSEESRMRICEEKDGRTKDGYTHAEKSYIFVDLS